MKSFTKQKNTIEEKTYPYLGVLGEASGVVVLFSNKATGMVVNQGTSTHKVGYYTTEWCESIFDYYDGVVELSN